MELPKGTIVRLVAHFDNSDRNPRNPNSPPRLVSWGEATTDEMCIGFIAVTKKDQDLTRPGAVDDLRAIFRRQREDAAKAVDRWRVVLRGSLTPPQMGWLGGVEPQAKPRLSCGVEVKTGGSLIARPQPPEESLVAPRIARPRRCTWRWA